MLFLSQKKQLKLHHHILQLLKLKIIETIINALFIAILLILIGQENMQYLLSVN